MTAGLYAQRAGLKTKVVEAYLLGGQMNNTSDIDNYLGLQNIHGGKLSEEMSAHLFKFNGEEDIVYDKVNEIDRDKDGMRLRPQGDRQCPYCGRAHRHRGRAGLPGRQRKLCGHVLQVLAGEDQKAAGGRQ